jgi:hypothetical protein
MFFKIVLSVVAVLCDHLTSSFFNYFKKHFIVFLIRKKKNKSILHFPSKNQLANKALKFRLDLTQPLTKLVCTVRDTSHL